MHRGIGLTASALVLAVLLTAVSPASASRLKAGDVKAGTLITSDVPIDDDFGGAALIGGGYVSCPAGTKIFTGGAYLYRTGLDPQPAAPRRAHVTSSTPTEDGNGWYADAVSRGNTELTLRTVLRCLPGLTTADVVWQSETITREDSGGEKTARCPDGYRAISGGTYFSTPGGGVEPDNAPSKVMNSTPTADGRGWFGRAVAFAELDITVAVRCMASDELAPYTRETVETEIGSHDTAVETGACPRSHPAVGPAGAFLSQPGKGPVGNLGEADNLSPGGALEAVRRFSAAAEIYSFDVDNVELVARVFCLRK
jgi:hypothetical protein